MLDLTTAIWLVFLVSFGLWALGFVFGTNKLKPFFLLMATWIISGVILLILKETNTVLPSITIIALSENDTAGLVNMLNAAVTLGTMMLVGSIGYLAHLLLKGRWNEYR